jgi:dimethylhistidine N-methyltransferase
LNEESLIKMLSPLPAESLQIKFLADSHESYQADVSLGEDAIQGLTKTPKRLPPKYFYDDLGSQLFEQICELPEYYPTRTETSILRECAQEIAQITGACELVELGSGNSTKTRLLLDAYQAVINRCKYVPIDVSGGILKASALQLQKEYPDLSIQGLVGTYEQALAQLEATSFPSRLIFFLGSSIGNFTSQECQVFLDNITAAIESGNYFLLGIDLQKPKDILEAAYNDSQGVTAAFNLNMLSHLNWRFQGNFKLDLFSHQAIYNEADSQIEMYLHCQKSHVVRLELLGLTVPFQARESILTEISRKFNLEEMQSQLESVGLKTVKVWLDPKHWFALMLSQT